MTNEEKQAACGIVTAALAKYRATRIAPVEGMTVEQLASAVQASDDAARALASAVDVAVDNGWLVLPNTEGGR